MPKLNFSLRTYIIVILLCAVGVGFGVREYKKNRLRQELNERFKMMKASIELMTEPAKAWGTALKKPVTGNNDYQQNNDGWRIEVMLDFQASETAPAVPSVRVTCRCEIIDGKVGPIQISGKEGTETQMYKRVLGKAAALPGYEYVIEDE